MVLINTKVSTAMQVWMEFEHLFFRYGKLNFVPWRYNYQLLILTEPRIFVLLKGKSFSAFMVISAAKYNKVYYEILWHVIDATWFYATVRRCCKLIFIATLFLCSLIIITKIEKKWILLTICVRLSCLLDALVNLKLQL